MAIIGAAAPVDVVTSSTGCLLRTVWEPDADLAVHRLQHAFDGDLQISGPCILYHEEEDQWFEPRMHVSVTTPEESMGDVMDDRNGRRGILEGMKDAEGGNACYLRDPTAAPAPLIQFGGNNQPAPSTNSDGRIR